MVPVFSDIVLGQFLCKYLSSSCIALALPALLCWGLWFICSSSFWKLFNFLLFFFSMSNDNFLFFFPEIRDFSCIISRVLFHFRWFISEKFTIERMALNLLERSTTIAYIWWCWSTMQSTLTFCPSFQLPQALSDWKYKSFIISLEFYIFRYEFR